MPHNRIVMLLSVALFLVASPASPVHAASHCDRQAKFTEWFELTQAPAGSGDKLIIALENYSNQIMAGVAANYGGEFPDDKYCEAMDKAISQYTSAGCYVVCAGFWEMCYTAQGSRPRVTKPSQAWQICEKGKKECVVANCAKAS